MDHAGATVGPLVAGALMAALAVGAETVILWSAVPGLLAVGVAVFALRHAGAPAPEAPRDAPSLRPHDADPPRRGVVVLIFLFAGVRLPETLLLLRLQDIGVAAAMIPVAWAALHVVRTAASYPGGWLADHVGAGRTMVVGWLLHAGVAGGLAVVGHPWVAGLAFLGLGLATACTESPERALVAAWGGRAARGRRFGFYHAGTGVLALPGGLALGALYQWYGGPAALWLSAVAALAIGLVGAVVARHRA